MYSRYLKHNLDYKKTDLHDCMMTKNKFIQKYFKKMVMYRCDYDGNLFMISFLRLK